MKITRILSILTAAALAAVCNTATAAPGDLDLTFGGTGKIITNFGNVIGRSVTLQGDGKIVVAGGHASGSFAVVRHNSDGSLDSSFNGTGKVTTTFGSSDTSGASVVVQGDDKIVVAGRSNGGIALARYNTNGTLDTAFGNAGKVTTDFGLGVGSEGLSIALQNDGKIVVAGSSISGLNTDFALVRYNTNGSLDTSFNGTGKVTTDFGRNDDIGNSVAIQTDGKIVVSGFSGTGGGGNYFFATARYTANGGLDTSFNGTGKVTTQIGGTVNRAYGVAIQSDGKIVSAGYCNVGNTEDFALVRYNTNGSLDTSFNGTGKVTTAIGSSDDEGYSVAMLDNGKILVAGASQGDRSDMVLVRYNGNGSLDTTFAGTGKVTTAITAAYDEIGLSVAVQSDQKILLAGYSYLNTNGDADFAIIRYEGDVDTDGDGIPDRFETGTGIYVSPTDTGTSPTNPDSDGDGLPDGKEVNTYHSNPNIRDTDGDGFEDGFEVSTGFSPTSAASTPDALSSIRTAAEYRFNAALGIRYRIEASPDLANWTTIEPNIIGAGGVITRFYSIDGQTRRYFRSRRN